MMATIPTYAQSNTDELLHLTVTTLRKMMSLSLADPDCAAAMAARIMALQDDGPATISDAHLRLDSIKRAIWQVWDSQLVEYRRSIELDDDLDISPENSLSFIFSRFTQLRALINASRGILEPLGSNCYLDDVSQLLITASDITNTCIRLPVFAEAM